MNKLIQNIINNIDSLISGDSLNRKPLFIVIGFVLFITILFGIVKGKNSAGKFSYDSSKGSSSSRYSLKNFERNTTRQSLLNNDSIQDSSIQTPGKINIPSKEKIIPETNEIIIEPDTHNKKQTNKITDKNRDLLIEPDSSRKPINKNTLHLRQKKLDDNPISNNYNTSKKHSSRKQSRVSGDKHIDQKIRVRHKKNRQPVIHKNLDIIE